ncbi:hypothetical protein ANO14919_117600 [Xylariales sp. No.14919]|nr:hypothetical protein F5X98DRAFT_345708 [Xylaria grammica]GAW22224.1 hypothetical protein ANO14919_117600 [Xylariales sp. No.14919]
MSTPKASTVSHKKGSTKRVLISPSEKANSYFPKRASTLTPASTTSAVITTETPLGSNTSASHHPLSPLDREYKNPFLYDIDVARQLSKQPTFWSVRGWVQRSASLNVEPAVEDPKARTRKFEEAKRDLLGSVSRC